MNIDFFLQITINGLLLGMFYALMTMGFSIIWGVMRLINLAHGEFLIMGAYLTWFFFNPQREQSLNIGSETPDEILSTIQGLFVAMGLVLGFIASEIVGNQTRFKTDLQKRLIGFPIGAAIAYIVYQLWKADDFEQISVPMVDIMRWGLILSAGFILSHLVLGFAASRLRDRGQLSDDMMRFEIWIRRLIGYGIAYFVVQYLFNRWADGGYEPIDPYQSLLALVILFFALGYVIQRGLFNRLVEGPYLTMLLITFAVSIILQNIGLQIYAADPRKTDTSYSGNFWDRGDMTNGTFEVPLLGVSLPNPFGLFSEESFPEITLSQDKTYIVLVSIILIAVLVWFLRYTRTGYAIRAAAQNKLAARLVGIDINETYAITFGIALAMTGIAGGLMGTFQPITPVTGARWTLRAFAIVALGGLGRIQGVVMGGLILGLTESYIGGYLPQINDAIPQFEIVNATGWAIAASFILLVVMLVLRPQGVAGGLAVESD